MNDDKQLFADWLARIEAKIDRMSEHDGRVDVTLTKQAGQLEHHIKRTDLLEARVEQVAGEVLPVKDALARAKGIAWFVGLVVAVVGFGLTVKQLLGG